VRAALSVSDRNDRVDDSILIACIAAMVSSMTKFQITTDLLNYDFQKADTRLCNNLLPSRRFLRWGGYLLLISGYGLAVILNRRFNTDAYNAFALLSLIGAGMLILIPFVMRARIYQAKRNAAIRNGGTTITLDEEGMHVEHTGARQVYSWTHAKDVIDGPDGLLVLLHSMQYEPIPSHDLPQGMEKNQMKAQIKEWISMSEN